MQTSTIMTYILIGILMVCGYIYLLQLVAGRTTNKPALPLISVMLLVLYILIGIPFVVIVFSLGNLEFVLLTLLAAVSFIILCSTIYGFFKHFRMLNKGMLILFLTYALAVAYITVFSRDGSNDTSIYLIQSDAIQEAIRTGSLEPLNHMLLNVALFIPLGFLLPFVYPEKLERFSPVLFMALMCTTAIESSQMLMALGQADLTDVVANTLGAMIGYGAYKIVVRYNRRRERLT